VSELRATLRIDPAPGAKKFQGVWLVVGDRKLLVDYRTSSLWQWFADREVLVTGETYRPDPRHQAVQTDHFRIATLRTTERGRGPYLAIGPETWLDGDVAIVHASAGSKLAGSSQSVFHASGRSLPIAGGVLPPPGPARVRARELEPDMSYAARGGGPDLWIVEVERG
jgi:hypothetical protein